MSSFASQLLKNRIELFPGLINDILFAAGFPLLVQVERNNQTFLLDNHKNDTQPLTFAKVVRLQGDAHLTNVYGISKPRESVSGHWLFSQTVYCLSNVFFGLRKMFKYRLKLAVKTMEIPDLQRHYSLEATALRSSRTSWSDAIAQSSARSSQSASIRLVIPFTNQGNGRLATSWSILSTLSRIEAALRYCASIHGADGQSSTCLSMNSRVSLMDILLSHFRCTRRRKKMAFHERPEFISTSVKRFCTIRLNWSIVWACVVMIGHLIWQRAKKGASLLYIKTVFIFTKNKKILEGKLFELHQTAVSGNTMPVSGKIRRPGLQTRIHGGRTALTQYWRYFYALLTGEVRPQHDTPLFGQVMWGAARPAGAVYRFAARIACPFCVLQARKGNQNPYTEVKP